VKFFTALNIFFLPFKIFEQLCACPEKHSVSWLYWTEYIYFYHSGFLSSLLLPWKSELSWKSSLYWVYFYIQKFCATCACPENRVCPESTVLNIYCLSFSIFAQLGLALKTKLALKFFKIGGGRPPPDSPPRAHVAASGSTRYL